ncbi:MAG: response regulator [Candidatus Dojkabacteria bacterium]|jgi:DNA-binding response OmpR family regulator|nr:response regulator [Candidatus Dojkabacteria bacterium]
MKKILFIEDETALQKTLGEVLKQEKYEVFSAFNGEDGLVLAKEQKPDLILLDLILPKIDGFEVLKQLKKDPETEDIPVIVLTNLEASENIGQVIELGATTYLVKAQYSLQELTEKVKKTLGE